MSGGCRVRVCRDCCCGSTSKHPGVDHDALLDRLLATEQADVSVSTCLLACERSNVVVVTPSPAGRRAGARPVWLAEVLDVRAVDAVSRWVSDGGPGLAPMPPALEPHLTARPSLPGFTEDAEEALLR